MSRRERIFWRYYFLVGISVQAFFAVHLFHEDRLTSTICTVLVFVLIWLAFHNERQLREL